MDNIKVTEAQYTNYMGGDNTGIKATIDGQTWNVPLDPANSHYAEILKQVADGTITIADAD